MFKVYEHFEDFVGALKAKGGAGEIYMKIVPHRDEKNMILSAEIVMQFMEKDNSLCHAHHYLSGLKAVKILPQGVFNVITDDRARAVEEQRYTELLQQFDDIIRKEYEKAVDLFVSMGFDKKNIIECYITAG